MKSVIIIGAGMGGLAAALRLRHLGFDVTVIEKQKRPGGRSNVLQEQGFRVDIGPTILVMKETFEDTYRAIGQDINQRIKFVNLDPNYRIYFHDGTHMDLYNSMAKLAAECERIEPGVTTRLFRFIGEGAKKYELGMDFVDAQLRSHHRPGEPQGRGAPGRDRLLPEAVRPGVSLLQDRQAAQGVHLPLDVPGSVALRRAGDVQPDHLRRPGGGDELSDGRHLQHHRGHGGAGRRDGRDPAHRHCRGGNSDRAAARPRASGWPAARS